MSSGPDTRDGLEVLPTYKELPRHEELDMGHSWGLFGNGDEIGTVGLLTDERVVAAAAEIREGRRFNLSLPLNLPDPPFGRNRVTYSHTIYDLDRNTQDDRLDGFYLQGSSQWDALRHIRAREFGHYNGFGIEEAGPSGDRLGISRLADFGIVGRGLLLDVGRHLAGSGDPIDPLTDREITADDLLRTMDAQGAAPKTGDIFLVRTGYVESYLHGSAEHRQQLHSQRASPGLRADEAMAEFLWDHHVAALATDNPAVENIPGSREVGSLHRRLIPMLGMTLGELFNFGALGSYCAERRRYTCMFVSAPLNLPGGVGSPANALAIV